MKIWLKLIIGMLIGVLLGKLFVRTAEVKEVFDFLSILVIHIGRYIIFPLIFFSLVMGTFELRRDKKILAVYAKTIVILILTTVFLTVIGAATVMVLAPERIPIIFEEEKLFQLPNVKDVILSIFPKNLFRVFFEYGGVLLPLVVFSILLGVNIGFNPQYTKSVIQFFDGLSRIFYHINSLFVELLGLGLIAVVTAQFTTLEPTDFSLFKQLLIVIGIDLILIICVFYPLLIYLVAGKRNPYRWLYASIAPAITAFLTGDELLSIGMLAKHGKEDLGLKRSVSSSVYPMFAIFGRGGTALVTCVSFILILKSYSSLEISFVEVLTVVGFSVLISFYLGSIPGLGAFAAIAILCGYHNLQEGYLILRPIASILVSAGVMLDVITSSLAAYLISKKEGNTDQIPVRDFV